MTTVQKTSAGLALFCLFGLGGCDLFSSSDNKSSAMGGAPAPEVVIIEVTPQRVVFTTELAGRTSPFQIAEVRPQVSGIIQKRNFVEGADVKAGEILYQIDPATYQASYDSARAALARAQANVAPLKLKVERFKDLVGISAVSKQEFEDTQASYKQALADVAVQEAAVDNARIRLDYTKVNSPIPGRIGKSSVTPGALVTENQAASMATVQQLDPMYVDVPQSSLEVMRLRKALAEGKLRTADSEHAAVRLFLEDGSLYPHEGTLQFTDVSVDRSTGAVTLRALFPNPNQDLFPNMYVRAELADGVDEAAILVPQRSIQRNTKGDATGYVVNAENKVERRSIEVSRTLGDSWVVTKGLNAGDKLIVEGLQRILPGAAVRIAAPQTETAKEDAPKAEGNKTAPAAESK